MVRKVIERSKYMEEVKRWWELNFGKRKVLGK